MSTKSIVDLYSMGASPQKSPYSALSSVKLKIVSEGENGRTSDGSHKMTYVVGDGTGVTKLVTYEDTNANVALLKKGASVLIQKVGTKKNFLFLTKHSTVFRCAVVDVHSEAVEMYRQENEVVQTTIANAIVGRHVVLEVTILAVEPTTETSAGIVNRKVKVQDASGTGVITFWREEARVPPNVGLTYKFTNVGVGHPFQGEAAFSFNTDSSKEEIQSKPATHEYCVEGIDEVGEKVKVLVSSNQAESSQPLLLTVEKSKFEEVHGPAAEIELPFTLVCSTEGARITAIKPQID